MTAQYGPSTETILVTAPAYKPTSFSSAMAQSSPSSGILGVPPSRAVATPPPISSILPLLSSAFTTGLSATFYFSGLFGTISRSLISPFLLIIPIALYLFSPIIISSQILFDTVVRMPFRTAVYVLQAVYPIYAFVGVACLSGIIIGIGARQIVSLVGTGLLGVEASSNQRSGSPPRTRVPRKSTSRGKRKVTVKTED